MLALHIAVGLWLGAMLIIGTVWGFTIVNDAIRKNLRYGSPWWRGLVPRIL